MPTVFDQVYEAISVWAESHAVQIRDAQLPPGTAGEFNGVAFKMNQAYAKEELAYYIVHALGSTVLWSLDQTAIQNMFHELRAARQNSEADPARLERAITRYRDFETESSELAVWLLSELGHGSVVPSYTNFMRADLEALTEFHRHGRAPIWREFFARWNADIAAGRKEVAPFQPRPIPAFNAVPFERQEILQKQDDGTPTA